MKVKSQDFSKIHSIYHQHSKITLQRKQWNIDFFLPVNGILFIDSFTIGLRMYFLVSFLAEKGILIISSKQDITFDPA